MPPEKQRVHAERMLARAERRHCQAAKLVDKWRLRIAELDRMGIEARQARLWADDHGDSTPETGTLS
ncbi:hypothetical protein [Granulicella rosea]|uniref:hypothetical protein n=1 Tax=Granulicella rosea TaxID=474952 RepID=UPI0015960D4F|nr:hypothetical protein [Granulicella rosea]